MRLAAIALGALILTGLPALAQPPPVLVIEAPPELAPARARLESWDLRPLSTIVRLVGLEVPGPPMRVVLATPLSEWARMVPPWASGFAVVEDGLIVLFPSRSPMYPHDTLEDVLRHEVAHVLIGRAAAGRPVPRWFHEGFAMAVERPWALEDRTRLASALLFGPRLDLSAIDALFLGNQGQQTRGYSLAAAVVRDLMREHGAGAPAGILRSVAQGRTFEYAVASVTAQSIPTFESAFWDRQRTWTVWIPLIASSTVLWLGVIGIAALAVRRRRRRGAEIRRRWADEESAWAAEESDAAEGTSMTGFERDVRAAVYASFRDIGRAPTPDGLAASLGSTRDAVVAALQALAREHCLVLQPDGESVWMAHPFSAVPTDFVVSIGDRRWFANCAWDGLSILGLFGDGRLETHAPGTGEPVTFEVTDGVVRGKGVIHFLVPAARFWDDIGYT